MLVIVQFNSKMHDAYIIKFTRSKFNLPETEQYYEAPYISMVRKYEII
jgi:hypothetical protein